MNKIVKDPIYQQLNKILKDLIESNNFKIGDKFLTERMICEKYSVSRATSNKALSNLVSEGILEFKKGVGTFIVEKKIDFDIRSLISFRNITMKNGKKPLTKVLRFEKIIGEKVDSKLVNELKISNHENLYLVERLRFVNGIPSILEKRYIVEKYCPNINKKSLEGSLYALWVDFYKLKIIGADQILKSVIIDKDDYNELGLKKKEPGFLVSAVGYIEGGIPLWSEKTLFRGTKYEFRNSVGQVESKYLLTSS